MYQVKINTYSSSISFSGCACLRSAADALVAGDALRWQFASLQSMAALSQAQSRSPSAALAELVERSCSLMDQLCKRLFAPARSENILDPCSAGHFLREEDARRAGPLVEQVLAVVQEHMQPFAAGMVKESQRGHSRCNSAPAPFAGFVPRSVHVKKSKTTVSV